MNLQDIMLSEISQTKTKIKILYDLTYNLYVESAGESGRKESRMMVIRSREVGERGRCWSKGTSLQQ